MMFEGKVAFVTGGASGIGRATALAFAAEGARVCVADVNPASEETVAAIAAAGGEAFAQQVDVSSAAQVEAMIDAIVARFGRLDYAFNGAGIVTPPGEAGTTVLCTEESWDRQIAVNLKGVWLCMKYAIPALIESGGGAIVNAASPAAMSAPGAVAYSASKGGVMSLTRSAAVEYASFGIRINAVIPGLTDTAMVRGMMAAPKVERDIPPIAYGKAAIDRFGQPEEIAQAVIWLCSDKASFVTGHALAADGGYLAHP